MTMFSLRGRPSLSHNIVDLINDLQNQNFTLGINCSYISILLLGMGVKVASAYILSYFDFP